MLDFKTEIAKLIAEKSGLDADFVLNAIEVPPDSKMGDYAFPTFSLAKQFRKNPVQIAEELATSIDDKLFEKIENKGAYLNFTIDKKVLAKEIFKSIREEKEDFGRADIGKDKTVIVEYSSTNIAKPFHIGHIRSTVIGDSIKRIYDFLGYDTVAINHIGDWGTQFGMLICAYKKWGDKEKIEKNPIDELLKLYVKVNRLAEEDEALKDECRSYFKKLEDGDEECVEIWKWFRDVSLKEFNRVYDMLDIHYDSYNGESFYTDKMPAVIEELREKNVLKKDQGAEIVDLEKYDLPPAIIIKSDGSTIYLTRDLAAAIYRHNHYRPYRNIYVVGSQQNLHFKQLKAVLEEMGCDFCDEIEHVAFGMVSLKDMTLSTRRGNVVYLEDVLNKSIEKVEDILRDRGDTEDPQLAKTIGIGAVKFGELFNNRIKDYTFDWDNILSFDGSTGPYVQYVHARISSMLKKGNFNFNDEVDSSLLDSEEEAEVLKLLYGFTDVVIDAHNRYELHLVSRFAIELSKSFNKFYNHKTVLCEDENLKKARLFLCYGVKITIANALSLLGIKAPDKM